MDVDEEDAKNTEPAGGEVFDMILAKTDERIDVVMQKHMSVINNNFKGIGMTLERLDKRMEVQEEESRRAAERHEMAMASMRNINEAMLCLGNGGDKQEPEPKTDAEEEAVVDGGNQPVMERATSVTPKVRASAAPYPVALRRSGRLQDRDTEVDPAGEQ